MKVVCVWHILHTLGIAEAIVLRKLNNNVNLSQVLLGWGGGLVEWVQEQGLQGVGWWCGKHKSGGSSSADRL